MYDFNFVFLKYSYLKILCVPTFSYSYYVWFINWNFLNKATVYMYLNDIPISKE